MTTHSRGISLKEYKRRKAQDEFSDWQTLKIPTKGIVMKDEIIERMNRSREQRDDSWVLVVFVIFSIVGMIQTVRWLMDVVL